MKHNLSIEIDCGKASCSTTSTGDCHLLQKVESNGKYICGLFNMYLVKKNGWVLRCNACLMSQVKHDYEH